VVVTRKFIRVCNEKITIHSADGYLCQPQPFVTLYYKVKMQVIQVKMVNGLKL
jgi:hypothetical protein